MKVLLISSLYPPYAVGGAERVVQTLATGLLQRGHDVLVLTTAPDKNERSAVIDGVRVDFVRVPNVYSPFSKGPRPSPARRAAFHAVDSWNPFAARMALRKARAYSPDVVNTHNITGFSPTIFSAIRRSGFPLVHTLHDQYLLCPKTTMYRNSNCSKPCLSCKPYASLRSSQAHTDLVVGVSKFILQRHRQFGAFENTPERVIYNSAPSWPSDIRRSTAKPLRFGYLGQIRPTKGLHVLIQAFMEEQLTNAELHIAGKGDAEYETNLRQLTESHTNIRWLGYSESKSFLESIDILVVPSLWNDTAPLVVMEAYSAGRPVLASRRGGIPELVTPETGWTFDPDDKRELRTMLRRCWSNPDGLIKMGENAKSVAKSYSTDRFLDAYEEAYASVKTRTL